jgi:uncharacterized membrane protein YdbT with pleckstrin-like domain
VKKTKYFESQQIGEDVLFLVRKHWFVLVGPIVGATIFYLMVIFGILVLPFLMPEATQGLSYNIYVLVISILLLMPTAYLFQVFVLYYLNVVIITNEHLVEILQERPFARSVSELEFGKVQDVSSKEHGLFQSLLNFGTIEVQTAGENRNFIFTRVPKPSDYAQKIMDLQEEYRRSGKKQPSGTEKNSNLPLENAGQGVNIKEEYNTEPTIEYPESKNQ